MVRPKKHLGQHFLTDPSIALRISEALEVPEGSTVLEIGPGTGMLTTHLLQRRLELFPVEIDSESVHFLLQKWPELKGRLMEGDFLDLDLSHLPAGPLHLIGNFPYNISSQIFFKALEHRQRVQGIVCMIQKEVADRIAAPPGSKTYGILSVLLQAYYQVELLFTVKPGSFHPPPKVLSGVIRLRRRERHSLDCNEALFFRVVKTCFMQRRKMIRNSIRSILLNLHGGDEWLTKRPEQLDVDQFISLTRWVENNLQKPVS